MVMTVPLRAVVESGAQRGSLPEIAPKLHDPDARVFALVRRFPQDSQGSVL